MSVDKDSAHGAEPVRDDDFRRGCGQFVQDLLKLLLRNRIDVRRGFVENENPWID